MAHVLCVEDVQAVCFRCGVQARLRIQTDEAHLDWCLSCGWRRRHDGQPEDVNLVGIGRLQLARTASAPRSNRAPDTLSALLGMDVVDVPADADRPVSAIAGS